ncbi:C40 family peptidase [Clostridium perfringens]
MNKRIFAISMSVLLFCGTIVKANPLQDKLEAEKNNLETVQKEYDYVLLEIGNIESRLLSLNREINEIGEYIESISKKIDKQEEEIKKTENNICIQQNKVDDLSNIIRNKVKRTYMNNSNEAQVLMEILLNSKSIRDFSKKVKVITTIIDSNKRTLDEFNEQKRVLENYVNEQYEDKNKLLLMKEEVENKQKLLNDSKNEQNEMLLKLNEKSELYKDEISKNEEEIEKIIKEIEFEESLAAISGHLNSYPSDGSTIGIDIARYALSFRGVPYLWGGTTPNGFDCSGLVQYVYTKFGIPMTRTTKTQILGGKPVGIGFEEIGDLVFFGDYSSPYHVGIYIGAGQYVHAPRTGDVVKVSSLRHKSDYCGARRYL